jgi:hypothetical protein
MLFGEAQMPIRDNLDEARADAIRLKVGHYDEYGQFYLDGPADIVWELIEVRRAA